MFDSSVTKWLIKIIFLSFHQNIPVCQKYVKMMHLEIEWDMEQT